MARRAVLLVGAALLGLHFAIAAFSQMPITPLKLRYFPRAAAYLEPYFAQNWMLFAPDPLSDDRGVLARARCADRTETPYYDVTSRYIQSAQSSRFFPSRMSRLVTGNVQQLTGGDPVLSRLREAEKAKKKKPLPLMPQEKTSQEEARRFLARYALTQLPTGACPSGVDGVRLRMYVHTPPPWSKRNDRSAEAAAAAAIETFDFDWTNAGDLR
ncbi:DUF5819 family protein [Streptomyces sp. NPDC089919]|uniref:DUF5819 family protein n=1 Tax=Streptomyces sp. NPDC089919 TaxID=3155188 RepID=UPI0034297501